MVRDTRIHTQTATPNIRSYQGRWLGGWGLLVFWDLGSDTTGREEGFQESHTATPVHKPSRSETTNYNYRSLCLIAGLWFDSIYPLLQHTYRNSLNRFDSMYTWQDPFDP